MTIPVVGRDLSSLNCIHAGPRHRLYRWPSAQGGRVLKAASADAQGIQGDASLRHEAHLLSGLEFGGVVRVERLSMAGSGLTLVLADAGDSNLAELLRRGPMPVADMLQVATQLADAVANLHRAHIVHRDIHPANVVWDTRSRRATLCDLANAAAFDTLTGSAPGGSPWQGALAYVSPEQTQRTGRRVDARTDLYSLGATFYEMLVGHVPFPHHDTVQLVHAHLARRPEAPHVSRGEVPLAVSSIVMKLLEKDPEHRFQTAEGLASDLREAADRYARTGTVELFALARSDVPRELVIADRLHGRDADMRTLGAALARARGGARELVLVSGAPGVGKSALVCELAQTVSARQGLFGAGKFDQLQRGVPLSGLAQAFKALVRHVLGEPEAALLDWRQRIAEAVGRNGRLLVDLVPELGRLLGPQPVPGDVGPVEAKNRFLRTVLRFLGALGRQGRPLMLFLDDVQWMDAASLEWLNHCLADDTLHHVLLVCAFRDTEVDGSHPLAAAMVSWRAAAHGIVEIHLEPLDRDDLARLAADAFGAPVDAMAALAELLLQKTAGNPFFVRRLLLLLHAQGLIRFEPAARAWQWNLAQLDGAPVADSVVELLTQSIARLPPATQAMLQSCACIGHRFMLQTLADVSGLPLSAVLRSLQPAFDDGLLLRMHDQPHGADLPAAAAQFAHDRVQQTAYSMLGEQRRRQVHLDIGRRLLQQAGEVPLDAQLFDTVDQLNFGASLIDDPAERLRVVELNLAAGRKANAAAAYQAAHGYLTAAAGLLPANPWHEQWALTAALHRAWAEAAYLTGRHAQAEQLIETALSHASSNVAKADLYSLRVLAATVVGDWAAALRWGREGLAVFGQAWPLQGLADCNEAEATAVMANVAGRRIEALLDEPEVQDADTRACMRLLSLLGPPAYFSGAEVLTFLVTRAANLSLRHGPSPHSAYAYVFYGALHNARTGEYDVGHAFGTLALALARRFADRAEESRVLEVFGLVVHVWREPLRDSLPLLKEGFRAGVESGELAYAAFNLNSVLINGLPAGVPLVELLADAEGALAFAARHANRTSTEIALPFRQFARALMGHTRSERSFDDDDFREAAFLERAAGNGTALGNFWVARLQFAYLMGDDEMAACASHEADKQVATGILGMMPSGEHAFYSALMLAGGATTGKDAVAGPAPQALLSRHRQLLNWASHCPATFEHKAALIGAEVARFAGERETASRLYRAAIDGAARQGFIQDEALAHERRAHFLAALQEPESAGAHFRAAHDRYHQWGAVAKARLLRRQRPEHFDRDDIRAARRPVSIDALALIEASQAISAEMQPEALFERILLVLVQVSGATGGAAVLLEADELMVRARIATAGEATVVLEQTRLADSPELPAKVIRYVTRTNEALVLGNASISDVFASDAAVQSRKLLSVMCVPLLHNARFGGLLYLENDVLANAFVDGIVEVVRVLAAQAVISLDNAGLHGSLRRELAQREQAESALREAHRRKDEFLAMLAHELRNPLAPIASAASLLQRAGADPVMVRKTSGVITRQVQHMKELVDDLLDVSRVTRGQVHLERVTVDLYRSLLDAVEQVRPLIEAKQHALTLQAPSQPALVRADAKRLIQIAANLLINAAKYTPDRGRITAGVRINDTFVRLQVDDTGQGMSADMVNTCFELFVQGERNSARSAGGLGIGLALVRSLVELQDGTVTAASDGPGRGSQFTVSLPLLITESAAPAATAPGGAGESPCRLKVLIVDDNEDAGQMLAMLIEELGHDPVLERHPLHALRRLDKETPDVCLLDIGLPDMDGFELARRVRDRLGGKAMMLAAVTGYGQPQDREQAAQAGFDAHFSKPLEMEQLESFLAKASERARPMQSS